MIVSVLRPPCCSTPRRGPVRWTPQTALWALVLLVSSLLTGQAAAQEKLATTLASRYATMRSQLDASPLGVPVLVASFDDGNEVRGEVYALLDQPFEQLLARLGVARDWCQIVLLHLNIKTCTHERATGREWLTFYSGRKFYESPDKAYPLRFVFHSSASPGEVLDLELSAATGPLNTSDYRITFSAIPIAQGSFVRFSYAYRSSVLSRLAMDTYLATLGRDKVGFTVAGTANDGKPKFVDGRRGIVERNAVRYYFAIQAHLEGLAAPPEQRFERNLARWFELTERFPRQLHELKADEYLQAKRLEFAEQSKRQRALDVAEAGLRTGATQ